MVELKSRFNESFEHLLDKLNPLTCNVVVSAIVNNSTKEDKMKLEEYWSYLQLEVADNIKDHVTFQENLNGRCSKILRQIEYSVFSDSSHGSTIKSGYTSNVPDSSFLLKSWANPGLIRGQMR